MRRRRWGEFPEELLAEIFGQVNMDLLAKSVSFVCKSWYKASLAPQLWQVIKFTFTELLSNESESRHLINPRWIAKDRRDCIKLEEIDIIHAYVRFAIHRSHQSATMVVFSWWYECEQLEQQALDCVAEGCPSLKKLVIGANNDYIDLQLAGLIYKWKNLETLEIGRNFGLEYIIPQISTPCKNFVELNVLGDTISCSVASAIATLPNLKILKLRYSNITRENVVILLNGCEQVECLDISESTGFEVDDDEILELASLISEFDCNRSDGYYSSKDEDDALETFMTCFGFSFSGVS